MVCLAELLRSCKKENCDFSALYLSYFNNCFILEFIINRITCNSFYCYYICNDAKSIFYTCFSHFDIFPLSLSRL